MPALYKDRSELCVDQLFWTRGLTSTVSTVETYTWVSVGFALEIQSEMVTGVANLREI